MVKERALAHGITLSLEIADDVDTLTGDERKVKQILFNLLSNAVKFTPTGANGPHGQHARQRGPGGGGHTGVGPATIAKRHFRSFNRWEGIGRKDRGDWSGSIWPKVCRAAWRHDRGGEHPGPREYLYLYPAGGRYGRAMQPCRLSRRTRPGPGRAFGQPLQVPLAGRRGRSKGQISPRIYLSEAGYSVDVARDGAEGLEKIRRLAPAAVVLDILLPKLDGWAFLTQVKADPVTRKCRSSLPRSSTRKAKGLRWAPPTSSYRCRRTTCCARYVLSA